MAIDKDLERKLGKKWKWLAALLAGMVLLLGAMVVSHYVGCA